MTALKGLRIVELSSRVTGEYAAKLLADFGAEVIKVEPPEGAATRAMGPFKDGQSVLFQYLNTNKRSVTIDLQRTARRSTRCSPMPMRWSWIRHLYGRRRMGWARNRSRIWCIATSPPLAKMLRPNGRSPGQST